MRDMQRKCTQDAVVGQSGQRLRGRQPGKTAEKARRWDWALKEEVDKAEKQSQERSQHVTRSGA